MVQRSESEGTDLKLSQAVVGILWEDCDEEHDISGRSERNLGLLALTLLAPERQRYTPTMLKRILALVILLCLAGTVIGQKAAGWKTTQDMSGSCQMSFPPDWSINTPPDGQAKSHEGTEALVVVGSNRKLEPLSTDMQKMLLVDRLLENTSQRVFYVMKPSNGIVKYIVDVQGKKTRCKAQIEVKVGHSEDDVKSIVATVGEKN
jgi:hypothetical protein